MGSTYIITQNIAGLEIYIYGGRIVRVIPNIIMVYAWYLYLYKNKGCDGAGSR